MPAATFKWWNNHVSLSTGAYLPKPITITWAQPKHQVWNHISLSASLNGYQHDRLLYNKYFLVTFMRRSRSPWFTTIFHILSFKMDREVLHLWTALTAVSMVINLDSSKQSITRNNFTSDENLNYNLADDITKDTELPVNQSLCKCQHHPLYQRPR